MNNRSNNTNRQQAAACQPYSAGRYAKVPFAVLTSAAFQSLSAGQIKVYLALAMHANAERVCWPKVETLARTAGVSDRTVQEAIKRLDAVGLLVMLKRGGGRNRTHRIRLIDEPDSNTQTDTINPEEHCGVSSDVNPEDSCGVLPVNPEDPAHKPRSPLRGNIQEQTCHGDEGSAQVLGLRKELSNAGVQGPNLDRLANLDNLTVDDVTTLAAIANEQAARNPAGLLVSMIKGGQRPATCPRPDPNDKPDITRPASRDEALALFASSSQPPYPKG